MCYPDSNPLSVGNYEFWLIKEAKKRNPDIKLAALSWGAPAIARNKDSGFEFFTEENIAYHSDFAKCISMMGYHLDWMGIWNESAWGNAAWLRRFRKAIGAETRLVLLDAIAGVDGEFLKTVREDEKFLTDLAPLGIGLHYPCHSKGMPNLEEFYALYEEKKMYEKNIRLYASEELSTPADWSGAGCWGRVLNTNIVRLNLTASIAWSLIWSTYPNLECFGNGLMYRGSAHLHKFQCFKRK